jgi:hypothetical protein
MDGKYDIVYSSQTLQWYTSPTAVDQASQKEDR